jgi:hypothetical protein
MVNVRKGLRKDLLATDGKTLKSGQHAKRPMPKTHRPELDETQELEPELPSQYQQLIGILQWAVELGRVDILLEVST